MIRRLSARPERATGFQCSKCKRPASGPLPRCEGCKEWGSIGAAVVDRGLWEPKKLASIAADKIRRRSLGNEALDALFGGGPVLGCSYLLNGAPGAGKSRFTLQASSWFESPLLVVAEEAAGAVKLRTKEMGIELPNLRIVETRDMELVCGHITDEFDLVIFDSASRMRSDDSNAAIGSPLQTASVIALASDVAHQLGSLVLVVGHINKDGEQSGMVANEHEVDGTLMLEKTAAADGRGRKFTITKHRHGPDPISVLCEMTSSGLDGFRLEKEQEAA